MYVIHWYCGKGVRDKNQAGAAWFFCLGEMAREFAKAFYKSKEWQQCREYILMRDKYLCIKCGCPAEEVHHKTRLTPANIGDVKISLNPDNLINLCKNCHFEEHKSDKAHGIRKANGLSDCDDEYEFDENGMLVRKIVSPPVK